MTQRLYVVRPSKRDGMRLHVLQLRHFGRGLCGAKMQPGGDTDCRAGNAAVSAIIADGRVCNHCKTRLIRTAAILDAWLA